jgi:predicted enzyme related to lactoylglutathione lyase
MTEVPSLYRVILQVSDLDKAAAFYTKLLGTPGRRIRGERHYFDCGAVILALLNPADGSEPARPMPDYLYFSVQHLETVYARAGELGCLSTDQVHNASAGEIVTRP